MDQDQKKIVKSYDSVDLQVDEGKREVISIINTDAVDRDGEVVQPKGMKKKNFSGNPVVFTNHDYAKLPVGVSRWVKESDGKLIAKTYFSDRTQESRDTFGLIQDGVLKAFSIGFTDLRSSPPSTKEVNARPDLKLAKKIIREWELLEYSVVGIPANPEALTLAVSKGYSGAIIDALSGKAANAATVTKQVVAAVSENPDLKKNWITEKEIMRLIAKEIDQATVAIDADKVFATAMSRLKDIAN